MNRTIISIQVLARMMKWIGTMQDLKTRKAKRLLIKFSKRMEYIGATKSNTRDRKSVV